MKKVLKMKIFFKLLVSRYSKQKLKLHCSCISLFHKEGTSNSEETNNEVYPKIEKKFYGHDSLT